MLFILTFKFIYNINAGNLRAHVRRLHLPAPRERVDGSQGQDLTHRCDDCSAIFRYVSSLTSHMSKFHGQNQQQQPMVVPVSCGSINFFF